MQDESLLLINREILSSACCSLKLNVHDRDACLLPTTLGDEQPWFVSILLGNSMKRFLLQAVTDEAHLDHLQDLLSIPRLHSATISTAFMTAAGLSLIEEQLNLIANRVRIFVGIRNGVTTVQAIQKAMEIGCTTYMVDTGSRTRIFHPKMYFVRSDVSAKLLLGSANLTMGGLITNVEASVLQELDPLQDAQFIGDLVGKFDQIVADFPVHVIRAETTEQLAALLNSGRLVDERKTRRPEPVGRSGDRNLDMIPKMNLRTFPKVVPRPAPAPALGAPAPAADAEAEPMVNLEWEQVWESTGLTRRHLNIPTGENTNRTGSMLLGLGAWENIDQRHYFRDEVFDALEWTNDTNPSRAHIERAEARVHIIIKDIDYGIRTLQLSHNSRTDTAAYRQSNSMTSLHWGGAIPLVAHEDLLNRVLKLYRNSAEPTNFLLEID